MVFRQKQLVNHPKINRTDPDIVPTLKQMYSGQCWASLLIQQLGKGCSCWQSWAIQQMMKMVPAMRQLEPLKKMEAANDPLNMQIIIQSKLIRPTDQSTSSQICLEGLISYTYLKCSTSRLIEQNPSTIVMVILHYRITPITEPTFTYSNVARSNSPLVRARYSWMIVRIRRTSLKQRLFLLILPILLRTIQQIPVLQMRARIVATKNETAQCPCHLGCVLPVSMRAVLPMRNIAPIMPKIIATSGWYFLILKTASLLMDLRQKWLVIHPKMTRTDPEMVAILKKMYSGQWSAQPLIQQ